MAIGKLLGGLFTRRNARKAQAITTALNQSELSVRIGKLEETVDLARRTVEDAKATVASAKSVAAKKKGA